MTNAEISRAIDLAKENPDASVDDIINEAKRPTEQTYEIVFTVSAKQYTLLENIAKKMRTDISTLAKDQVMKLVATEEGR